MAIRDSSNVIHATEGEHSLGEKRSPATLSRADITRWATAAAVLLLILKIRLLPALIAALLIYELAHGLARFLKLGSISRHSAKVTAVTLLSAALVVLVAAAILGMASILRHGSDSLPALFQEMAEIIEHSRERVPESFLNSLPADAEELRTASVAWLRTHSGFLQSAGGNAGRIAAHILIGLVIGALLALHETASEGARGPLANAVTETAERVSDAFRRVVFAQIWIATINTLFTGLYLAVVLPMFGVHLPLTKTLIVITWVFGLMPIIGNLLSNTIIAIVSLSSSLNVAIASMVFLVVIHKLEYFLNARIIGSHIRARAWELLIAMLVMDAMFGIAGLIAAPIYYAYAKDELTRKRLI